MIHMDLIRYRTTETTTNGLLFFNGEYECGILEDEPRMVKVYGKTRIPEGTYDINFRTSGRLHEKYKKRFAFHEGMLELQNVPDFTFIYIHIGNTHLDTLGCLLTGENFSPSGNYIYNSTKAYEKLYLKVLENYDPGREFKISIFTAPNIPRI